MTTTSLETVLPAGTWELDKVHSSAGFAVKHMVVSTFRSRFTEVDATLVATDGGARLDGTVQVASIDIADPNLKGHLLSPEFFDAEVNPAITFVAADIRRTGNDVVVEGDLTIKGHTERVSATGTITDPHEDFTNTERIGLSLETTLDRNVYGLTWNAPLPKGGFALADDVTLRVDLEFTRAAVQA
jgi:polyisoprenoid-binding protein YceI